MHGNFIFAQGADLEITICNGGSDLESGRLVAEISNSSGTVKDRKVVEGLVVPRGVLKVLTYRLRDLTPDLYSVEYYLHDEKGNELGRSLDLFYIDPSKKN
jgi:hypothetical protein